MSIDPDVLYTLAKVAATLAGFSGVVVGLRLRGASGWSATESRILWLLIAGVRVPGVLVLHRTGFTA